MKFIHKNQDTENVTILQFDADEIMKSVFAECALVALSGSEEQPRPTPVTRDNRNLLYAILANGYFAISSALIGYIECYDFDSLEKGTITIGLNIPPALKKLPSYASLMQKRIEYALTYFIVAEIYRPEPYGQEIAEGYSQLYNKAVKRIVASFALE